MTINERQRVAVIGGGVIGTMTSWQLAKRANDVTVYEQWNSPNDRGASAGESRIFRTIYKEGPEYVPILRKSFDMWQELQTNQSVKVLELCGGLMIGLPELPDVNAVVTCAQTADLEHRILDTAEMATEFPQYRLDNGEIGVFDPVSGVFRPEAAVLAARKEAERLGAKFRPYSRVLNIRTTSSSVIVDSATGAKPYDKIVVATGPWVNELSSLDPGVVSPRRLVAAWFPARDVSMHTPDKMPIAIRRHWEGEFSCFPVLDGLSVKILPHHLSWLNLETVDQLPRFVEPEFVQAAEQSVARLMPGLDSVPIRVSTWTEGFAADETPIVGPSEVDSRIVLAVGMSGQGFKFSPMIGSIVADFVESNDSSDVIETMDSLRFARGQR